MPNIMKIEIPFLPALLLLLGTDMLARVAVQGLEPALLSKVLELSISKFKAASGRC